MMSMRASPHYCCLQQSHAYVYVFGCALGGYSNIANVNVVDTQVANEHNQSAYGESAKSMAKDKVNT